MNLSKLRYRFLALILVLVILPSIIGVHVFRHFCHGCEQSSVVTTLITTDHSHIHDCAGCMCTTACHGCYDAEGAHMHHGTETCEHQFAKGNFEGQRTVVDFSFVAVQFDLFYYSELIADLQSDNINHKHRFHNVIQNISDEPSLVKNCVFRL